MLWFYYEKDLKILELGYHLFENELYRFEIKKNY